MRTIPNIENPPKDSVFTIEKYYKGQYYGVQPNQQFFIYPNYSLPDTISYKNVIVFANSFNSKNSKYCREKFCKDKLLIESNCIENNDSKTILHPYGISPVKTTNCVFCKRELITHLKGNLREMTNVKGQFFGISFIDTCEMPINICRQDSILTNSYSGFRNICKYRQWGK